MKNAVLALLTVAGFASLSSEAAAGWRSCNVTVTVKNETDHRAVLDASKTKTTLHGNVNNPLFTSDKIINANRTKSFVFDLNKCWNTSYEIHPFTFIFDVDGQEVKVNKSLWVYYDQKFTIRVRD